MRAHGMRRQIHLFVILSILFCEICFSDQPLKTYSFFGSVSEISSGVQIHIDREKQVIGREQLKTGSEAREILRRTSRRTIHSLIRRMPAGFSNVDFLPQIFHSSIFLQNNEVCHNTSGHIALIRCIYRKDGKKRDLV